MNFIRVDHYSTHIFHNRGLVIFVRFSAPMRPWPQLQTIKCTKSPLTESTLPREGEDGSVSLVLFVRLSSDRECRINQSSVRVTSTTSS